MSKKLTLLSFALLIAIQGYSQNRDTIERNQQNRNFIRKRLNVDSVKAEQVNEIQYAYKKGVGQVMDNNGLSEAQKRKAVEALMQDKNKKLESILTPQQQEMMIPTTERTKNKTVEKKKPN